MFKTKYRIVVDSYAGYEVQYKPWWWPWFIQCEFINTHRTLEGAKKYLELYKNGLVVYVED